MSISKQIIIKTALLAKLGSSSEGLPSGFVDAMATDLNKVLATAQELQSINTEGVDPTEPFLVNTLSDLRPDQPYTNLDEYKSVKEAIKQAFPVSSGGYCAIKKTM